MDLNRLVEIFDAQKWIFAKTMPWCPHEYCLRKNFERDEEFVEAARYIRENGVVEEWKSPRSSYTTHFTYLYLDGWKYWTMGCPLHNCEKTGTVVINRAKVEQ